MLKDSYGRIVAGAMLAMVLLLMPGCAESAVDTPVSSAPDETTEALRPSATSIDYALELGGTSHTGETLYLVVGASASSEPAAQQILEAALPLFGDMQPYFIVQASDTFDGLAAGQWVVVEAYRERPSEENLEFGRRAFPDARVERVVVGNADPIPVYEDMVGQ